MNYPLPSNDPLGTDLAIDHNGDLILTMTGGVQVAKDVENVAQSIRTQLMTDAFSYLWGEEVGTALASYVDAPVTDQREKEIQNIVIEKLNQDPRIIAVQGVDIDDSQDGKLIITPRAIVQGIGAVTLAVQIGGVQA